jgi:hypothetical protein
MVAQMCNRQNKEAVGFKTILHNRSKCSISLSEKGLIYARAKLTRATYLCLHKVLCRKD